MKDILKAVKESLGTISVVFACAASVFCVMRLGEGTVLLIAICAYILYIGLAIAIKRMNKEKSK